jgi:multidrug efflux pump subunit AcrB
LPVGILLALIVDLVGILLIILEVRRPKAKSISVEQAAGGEVTLSVASIADQLRAELSQMPEVIQVKPKVSAKRKGVVVEVDARIAAEAGVPNKAERIVETIRRVVEQRMGLRLVRAPKVNIEAVRRGSDARQVSEQPTLVSTTDSGSQGSADAEGQVSG